MAASSSSIVIAHWSTLLEGLSASPLDFYRSVEEAISKREIPDVRLSRVDWSETGPFTAKREYLRVTRGSHVLDICGAPFGTGFFVSSWLIATQSQAGLLALFALLLAGAGGLLLFVMLFGPIVGMVLAPVGLPFVLWVFVQVMNRVRYGWDDSLVAMPLIGWLYQWVFRRDTYYRIDTAVMFQTAVHSALMESVDELTRASGHRSLADLERKPTLRLFGS